ncbi:unnamed protein product [Pedinophyceae sp. YPF-701]|nr:unnamed protein product [Pedinophyceae sp. YPF-701]
MDLTDPTFVLGKNTGELKAFYNLGAKLGEGQFGIARQAVCKKTGRTMACKTIEKRKLACVEDVEDVRREVQIMNHLAGHSNIVKIEDSFEDRRAVHIVMEMCSGGELFDRIVEAKHYSEKKAADMARTIVEAVAYMHDMGVIHRDLKPENFLLVDNSADSPIKFTDFGLSVFFKEGDKFADTVGSAYYIAPEVLDRAVNPKTRRLESRKPQYAEKIDVWSCGVILYILLAGVPPFWGNNTDEIFEEILLGKLDLSSHPWDRISDGAKACIKRMLTRDPRKRPSASEMLRDPWLMKGGIAPDRELDNVVAQRLKAFKNMNNLKKKAMQVIASHLDKDEIAGLENMFKAIDTDNSGTITIDELRSAMQKGHYKITEDDIKFLMEAADVDGNGEIDYKEFIAATIHNSKLEKDELIFKAFKAFDKNGDGVLSISEITEALKDMNVDDAEVRRIIKEVDKDGNGEVDYEEFLVMMRGEQLASQQSVSRRRGVKL